MVTLRSILLDAILSYLNGNKDGLRNAKRKLMKIVGRSPEYYYAYFVITGNLPENPYEKLYIFSEVLENMLEVKRYWKIIKDKIDSEGKVPWIYISNLSLHIFSLPFKDPFGVMYELLRSAGFPEDDTKEIILAYRRINETLSNKFQIDNSNVLQRLPNSAVNPSIINANYILNEMTYRISEELEKLSKKLRTLEEVKRSRSDTVSGTRDVP